jgi:SAM-dependent methyltransferase
MADPGPGPAGAWAHPGTARLFERYYPVGDDGVRRGDLNAALFAALASGLTAASPVVLCLGPGPTTPPERRMKGRVGRLVGVDPDPGVMTNPDLDEAHVNDGVSIPFPDAHFDAAYGTWVAEHVEQPVPFLREVHRVLKPGASLHLLTPNLRHYATLASAALPLSVHRRLVPRLIGREAAHDPYPTMYRLNTPRQVRAAMAAAGFPAPTISFLEAQPGYLGFHPAAFLAGVAYERLVNRSRRLEGLRATMLVRATRAD